jgi:hypothetical protein
VYGKDEDLCRSECDGEGDGESKGVGRKKTTSIQFEDVGWGWKLPLGGRPAVRMRSFLGSGRGCVGC